MVEPALFDTNILIDFLNGLPQARKEIACYRDRAVSVVTWMEVMTGLYPEQEDAMLLFLSDFELVSLSPAIAKQAELVRRETKLKSLDAIILASAQVEKRLLVTRNTRDFQGKASRDAGIL